jgi:alkyl hydroperoxide reductase subunit D
MQAIEALKIRFPESAKDSKLNISSVLTSGSLSNDQKWGVAIASAIAARYPGLSKAVLDDARAAGVAEATIEDAKAAATLMAMNNVYYRFRHMIGKESYSTKPARLRMNRLVQPASNKIDLELYSLAVSAINGCEMCLQAHEKVVLDGGLTEEQVHDAVRIASVIHASAVALELKDSLEA